MKVKDLLAQVLKISPAPPNAFLTVNNNPAQGATPKKLEDKNMLLATLFEESHTLHFDVKHEAGKSPRTAAHKQTQKA